VPAAVTARTEELPRSRHDERYESRLKSRPGPLQGPRKSAVRPSVSRAPRCESVAERLSRAFSVVEFQGDLGCEDVRADDQTDGVRELWINLRR
jgi:hypothetical protein